MYNFFKGKVVEILTDKIVLENNNIGYEIFLSERDIRSIYDKEEVKVYTYFNVREDAMLLYGFMDKEDKNTFIQLLNVSKVGTKTALSILNKLSSSEITLALENSDVNTISKCPGVGKKTAERIILELKGKLVVSSDIINIQNTDMNDAYEAMIGLGFDETSIKKIFKKIDNIDKLSTEEIIKLGLKELGNA